MVINLGITFDKENIRLVFEIFVPNPYVLNDNNKNDYRSNMGKMKWLDDQTKLGVENCIKGYPECAKLLCWVEKLENIDIDKENFGLIINHIKIGGRYFDLFNYERTMKPCIDVLTSSGYWRDDNFIYCNPVLMIGGSSVLGIKDTFGILPDDFKSQKGIKEYFQRNIPEYWLTKTKFNKISMYDLFQIYTIKL